MRFGNELLATKQAQREREETKRWRKKAARRGKERNGKNREMGIYRVLEEIKRALQGNLRRLLN
jgi:hypothetical protein